MEKNQMENNEEIKEPTEAPEVTEEPVARDYKRAVLTRALVDSEINWDERTLDISFSSEEPVLRSFGYEILGHKDPNKINLQRLNDGAPVLLQHDPDKQIGVVESASIDTVNRRGRARIRLGRSALATEILQDIQDGIRRNISFGYFTMDDPKKVEKIDGFDAYRFEAWEAFEISVVSIPADNTIGVGRSIDVQPLNINKEDTTMSDNENKAPDVNVKEIREAVIREEKEKAKAILTLGKQTKLEKEASEFVAAGKSVEEFRDFALEHLSKGTADVRSDVVGLTDKETKSYSLFRAIQSRLHPDDRKLRDAAGFELEVSAELARKMNAEHDPRKVHIPAEVLNKSVRTIKDGAGVGDEFIPQLNPNANYIEALRADSVIMRLATVLPGLTSDIRIPKETAKSVPVWYAEDGTITEDSTLAFGTVNMTAKGVGVNRPVTHKMLISSVPSVEQAVIRSFTRDIALAIEDVCLHGAGANEPTGLLGTPIASGVVANGTMTYLDATANMGLVFNNDVSTGGNLAWVTYPSVYTKAMGTAAFSGGGTGIIDNGILAGYPAYMTSKVGTKGINSTTHAIFGSWDYLWVGLFGGMYVLVNPYSEATKGNVVIHAQQYVDVAVTQSGAFRALANLATS